MRAGFLAGTFFGAALTIGHIGYTSPELCEFNDIKRENSGAKISFSPIKLGCDIRKIVDNPSKYLYLPKW